MKPPRSMRNTTLGMICEILHQAGVKEWPTVEDSSGHDRDTHQLNKWLILLRRNAKRNYSRTPHTFPTFTRGIEVLSYNSSILFSIPNCDFCAMKLVLAGAPGFSTKMKCLIMITMKEIQGLEY